MSSSKTFVSAVLGVAMLAMPAIASAHDYHHRTNWFEHHEFAGGHNWARENHDRGWYPGYRANYGYAVPPVTTPYFGRYYPSTYAPNYAYGENPVAPFGAGSNYRARLMEQRQNSRVALQRASATGNRNVAHDALENINKDNRQLYLLNKQAGIGYNNRAFYTNGYAAPYSSPLASFINPSRGYAAAPYGGGYAANGYANPYAYSGTPGISALAPLLQNFVR